MILSHQQTSSNDRSSFVLERRDRKLLLTNKRTHQQLTDALFVEILQHRPPNLTPVITKGSCRPQKAVAPSSGEVYAELCSYFDWACNKLEKNYQDLQVSNVCWWRSCMLMLTCHFLGADGQHGLGSGRVCGCLHVLIMLIPFDIGSAHPTALEVSLQNK
jgi:hypothetical protein